MQRLGLSLGKAQIEHLQQELGATAAANTADISLNIERSAKWRQNYKLTKRNRRSTFRCSRLYYGETLGRERPGKFGSSGPWGRH